MISRVMQKGVSCAVAAKMEVDEPTALHFCVSQRMRPLSKTTLLLIIMITLMSNVDIYILTKLTDS